MDLAKNILESVIEKNIAAKNIISGYKAVDLWNEIIDEEKTSWAEKFSRGVLYVSSENPSFMQEIIFRKNMIIDKLNSALGAKAIKDIKGKLKNREGN